MIPPEVADLARLIREADASIDEDAAIGTAFAMVNGLKKAGWLFFRQSGEGFVVSGS